MNIYSTINDYIKHNIEYDELNNRLECLKRNCAYVEAKGDIEFHKGRFDKEKDYNEFHKIYKTECERIECELTELDKHRAEIHNQYMEELENLSNDDIREVIDDLLQKKKNKETEIYYLSLERTDAQASGEEAFESKDFENETIYNNICKKCNKKIESLLPYVKYYDAFINNLVSCIENRKQYKKTC